MRGHTQIATYVPDELAERLCRAAEADDRTRSAVIRRALEAYLPNYEEDPATHRVVSEGSPRDEAAQLPES